MTTPTRDGRRPRWVLAFLAAVLAVLVAAFGAAPASAATTPAAQNGVGASTSASQVVVGPSVGIGAGQQLGNDPPQPQIVVATGAAANTAASTADDWANVSGVLRDASRGKGNFGVGTGTAAEAQSAGRAWVGEGARPASDGFGGWVSSDGLRMWRPPSFKPQEGLWQSNFQWRNSLNQTWQGNGHLDITDLP